MKARGFPDRKVLMDELMASLVNKVVGESVAFFLARLYMWYVCETLCVGSKWEPKVVV